MAFEILRCMKNYKSRSTSYMALKLNMSKAYDRVEQDFLENLMRRMSFNERWINLIMTCIRTVTYSILVHGEPKGLIYPTSGLRQGDPLSPFLFLLSTKGLNGLIKQVTSRGTLLALHFVREVQNSHICFLWMLASCFVGQQWWNVERWWISYLCMRVFRVRS